MYKRQGIAPEKFIAKIFAKYVEMKLLIETGISTDINQNILLIVSWSITKQVAIKMLTMRLTMFIVIFVPPQPP